ncbi:MAG: BTAD domain-containing putative transcriptional regulator [Ilumatobacteraceae bacterium]
MLQFVNKGAACWCWVDHRNAVVDDLQTLVVTMSYDSPSSLEAAMRYEVLGPVRAKFDDVVVAVGGPQQRRLLALLLSQPGQSVSSQRLVDCLWPDGLAPDGAGRSVMTYVSRLRAALGESSISTVEEGYRLELGDELTDAQQFEALLAEAGTEEPGRAVEIYDRALGLWRGGAYGDFGADWWLLADANRLNEMRTVAREERAEAVLAVGHHHRVIPELERLVTDEPLRERSTSLLMQALFVAGRHADALRAFQSFRTRLADETGLDPSDDLVALERSMASGKPIANLNARARLLRGYSVHEVLGEGASGRVFAATQPGTNREVAIKAIRPDLSNNAEFIQRFEAEAQLVARLEHPHIVPLYDYWREPGGAYLVFRLLLGGTAFAAMVSDGPFSVARVSRLVEEVGGALLSAHTAGVVHCDIKPSNVMFDEAGNGYLSDFGIAVTTSPYDQGGDRTRAYAAPELIDRSGDTVRSDIFSFGCMLWELLASTSPLSVMQSNGRWRLPSLAGVLSGPSEALDAVLAKATSHDPDVRFESMADLIIAWRDAVGRPEGVLSPMGSPSSSSPGSSRRRAVRALSTTVSAAVNPYKGLRAFSEADAADFFGRDDVAIALLQTVVTRGFVVVVGPSGSGKSSLVHAGLVPRLRNDGVRVATMLPGDRPTTALRQALREVAATDCDTDDPIEWLREAAAEGTANLTLVIDQFEECWTLADSAERERFLNAVVIAASFGVRCVATVRADLYDRPLQHASIGQMVADGTFALPPLSPQALEEVVARPAERNGVGFDDGVVAAIVAEASAHPAGLPLLQFAMAELYERRVDNCVTSRSLNEMGGLGGAIGRRAEDIYSSLDDDVRTQTRQLFGRLVAPGQGGPDTRRRARFSELSEADRTVADRFVEARLLVADRDLATREPVIEVAHEALLANWPRLREWLEADRRWLAQLQHLATATRAWNETLRPDGELYSGSRLEAVLEALPDHSQQLSPDEHAFVEVSRSARDASHERDRQRARRLRRLLVATACFLVLALLAGVVAFTQRQQARTAATRAIAAQRDAEIAALVGRSVSIRSSQRDIAALLAIEAYRSSDNPRTRSALLSTFTADVGFLGTNRLSQTLGDSIEGIVMPDGKTAFVVRADHRIRSYDLDSGDVGDEWPLVIEDVTSAGSYHGDSHFVSSSDGGLLAQIYWYADWRSQQRSVLVVFDTITHQPVIGPIAMPVVVDSAVFDPDNSRLYVSGGFDGEVIGYSISDGSAIGPLTNLSRPSDSYLLATTAGLAFVTGGLLAVGSEAGPVRLVDPLTFEVVRQISAPRGTTEVLVAIDGGNTLIGNGIFGRVRLNVSTSTGPSWVVGVDDETEVLCTVFTVAEKIGRFYCGDSRGRLEERDLRTGGFIRELSAQNGANSATSNWLARDQTELVNFNSNESLVARWRLDGSGPVSRRISGDALTDAYSPDGRRMLALLGLTQASNTFGVGVVDLATGDVVDVPPSLESSAWRADGTIIGWTDVGATPTLAIFDPRTQQLRPTALTLNRQVDGWFVSEHRLWLYFASDDSSGGEIWTIDTDTVTRIEPTIQVDSFSSGAGSNSGDRLGVSTQAGVVVFDGVTGETLHTFADGAAASFLPGNRVVDITADGEMTVYDTNSFKTVVTLGGLRGFGAIEASANGSLAIATGDDRRVILYDTSAGEQIGDPLVIPDTEFQQSSLRPDGKEMAIGGSAGHGFVVWDLDPEHWVVAACRIAGRNLTRAEWSTNIGDLADYHLTCPDYP